MDQAELFSPEPPRRQSGGCCGPVTLGLTVGCGAMLLLCCAGLIGGVWYLKDFVAKAFDTDPLVVKKTTAEIAQIDIPELFEPEVTFVADFPVIGLVGKGVIYQARQGSGILVLADVDAQKIGMTPEQIAAELREEAESRGRGNNERPTVAPEPQVGQPPEPPAEADAEEADAAKISAELVEVTIRGKQVPFELYRHMGEGKEAGTEYWRAVGSWEGHLGSGFLMLEMPTSQITREEIVKMLQSIR